MYKRPVGEKKMLKEVDEKLWKLRTNRGRKTVKSEYFLNINRKVRRKAVIL